MTKRITETKVTRRDSYDRLVVKVQYPSGGSVELRINRYSDTVLVAGSNDPTESKRQLQLVSKWSALRKDETHGQRAERFAAEAGKHRTVGQFVAAIEAENAAARSREMAAAVAAIETLAGRK